jgi:hypothetical protein
MTDFGLSCYCSDRSCFNADCPANIDEPLVAWAKHHNLEIKQDSLVDTDVCIGYKSLDDIIQSIKKKFPDFYWEEE